MQSFKEYMKQYAGINHRFGDLAEDIQADEDFPDTTDYKEIYSYLSNSGACGDCLDTFLDAWRTYTERSKDQIMLYIAMLIDKLDALVDINWKIDNTLEDLAKFNSRIADALEYLGDDDDTSTLGAISANINNVVGINRRTGDGYFRAARTSEHN